MTDEESREWTLGQIAFLATLFTLGFVAGSGLANGQDPFAYIQFLSFEIL